MTIHKRFYNYNNKYLIKLINKGTKIHTKDELKIYKDAGKMLKISHHVIGDEWKNRQLLNRRSCGGDCIDLITT